MNLPSIPPPLASGGLNVAVSRTVLPPIPRWKIATGVGVVALLTAGAVAVLWSAGIRGLAGIDLVTARLNALKVGLSIGVGGGGLFALYLAWRRQQSTEADLDNRERALAHHLRIAADSKAHQERVAAATEADALERRITDLYARAADQLGSDKAPVRLAGLYALERLAQDNPDQRQTIVNLWCAYLRMPYALPGDPPNDDAQPQQLAKYQEYVQEREVRIAAQRVLTTHLRPSVDSPQPVDTFWPDIDIDLTGATLIDIDLTRCLFRTLTLSQTYFVGDARFNRAQFPKGASFYGAEFTGVARFNNAKFSDDARFSRAKFPSGASFYGAEFAGDVRFNRTNFDNGASFNGAKFSGVTRFNRVHFAGGVRFDGVEFMGNASFEGAQFEGGAAFSQARFADAVPPELAEFVPDSPHSVAA